MNKSDEILNAYLKLSQHVSRHFRLHFGRLNLTFPQALVLNVLLEEAPVPISLLAERIGSANSTVSGIVDRLEKMEMVRRERSDDDRRVIYVNLTEKFRALRENADADVKGYFSVLLDKLTEEEKTSICESMQCLNRVLEQAAGEGEE